jgi:hypothetical protein
MIAVALARVRQHEITATLNRGGIGGRVGGAEGGEGAGGDGPAGCPFLIVRKMSPAVPS